MFFLTIAEDKYYQQCHDTNRWWDASMIGTFAAFCVHAAHSKKISYVHSSLGNSVKEKPTTISLPKETEELFLLDMQGCTMPYSGCYS